MDGPGSRGDAEIAASADPAGPFAALVFKTRVDRYAGTLSIFRVISGTIKADTPVLNATRDRKERLGKLLLLQGAEYVDVPEAGPGDIVAVAKLKDVHTGDALTQEKGGVRLAEIPIPQGVLSYAIGAKTKGDEDKVFTSLGRLVEEDPILRLGRDPSTGEFLLTGMGELHIRMTVKKLRRLYDVDVELKTPKVPYRETITRKAENVEGKLKKQTGGKGMFGVCYLDARAETSGGHRVRRPDRGRIDPAESDSGGRRRACTMELVRPVGPLAGYPVVDVRVRASTASTTGSTRTRSPSSWRDRSVSRPPLPRASRHAVRAHDERRDRGPRRYVGDIMGDVSSRRGRVQSSENHGARAKS